MTANLDPPSQQPKHSASTSEDSAALANLLGLPSLIGHVWKSDELSAILRHQMSAPVQFDLSELPTGQGAKLRSLAAAQGLLIQSFSELLRHPHPPVELLVMTKRFAKASSHHPDSPLPPEIAKVLYYASIVVALTRCGKRISGLDDAVLRQGLTWAMSQPWLSQETRTIFEEGLKTLRPEEGSPS